MRVGTMTNNDRTYMGLRRSTQLPCGERGVTCCGLFEQRICSGWCGWGWWAVVGLLAVTPRLGAFVVLLPSSLSPFLPCLLGSYPPESCHSQYPHRKAATFGMIWSPHLSNLWHSGTKG